MKQQEGDNPPLHQHASLDEVSFDKSSTVLQNYTFRTSVVLCNHSLRRNPDMHIHKLRKLVVELRRGIVEGK